MSEDLELREMTEDDLPVLFEHQRDPRACRMAAFTVKDPDDWDAYQSKWKRLIASDATLTRTVVEDGRVVGMAAAFERDGEREVTYWIGSDHWGRGVATAGLARLLRELTARPLYARVARDNAASIRVLEKSGFALVGEEKGHANARGGEVDELVYRLE